MNKTSGTSGIDPRLPQNIEAERSVLGAILLDNAVLDLVCTKLATGDFFAPTGSSSPHQILFHAMKTMRGAGHPIDLVTLTEHLNEHRQLDNAGGAGYISALIDGVPHVSNVEHYAQIVKDKSRLRQMVYAAHSIQTSALEAGASYELLQERARAFLQQDSPLAGAANGNGHFELKDYSLSEFLSAQFPIPEHLIEGVVPRNGSVLIVAMPHRLKSWFTTGIALGATRAGMALGQLEVKKPVRTYLVQVEDFPGQLQQRVLELSSTASYLDCDPDCVRFMPREEINSGFFLPDEKYFQALLRRVEKFKADHVILDVVRRIFHGDINSPQDTTVFLEQIDRLREMTGTAVTLVHHENKKGEEIMTAGAGSYTLPSWANVMIQFRRKTMEPSAVPGKQMTHVEIEIDNKLAQSPEPLRLTLDLTADLPLRIQNLEDATGIMEAQERLGGEWTVRDLAEALDLHKANAYRRLKKWLASGNAEKISGGKSGRKGGLANYRFLDGVKE